MLHEEISKTNLKFEGVLVDRYSRKKDCRIYVDLAKDNKIVIHSLSILNISFNIARVIYGDVTIVNESIDTWNIVKDGTVVGHIIWFKNMKQTYEIDVWSKLDTYADVVEYLKNI